MVSLLQRHISFHSGPVVVHYHQFGFSNNDFFVPERKSSTKQFTSQSCNVYEYQGALHTLPVEHISNKSFGYHLLIRGVPTPRVTACFLVWRRLWVLHQFKSNSVPMDSIHMFYSIVPKTIMTIKTIETPINHYLSHCSANVCYGYTVMMTFNNSWLPL